MVSKLSNFLLISFILVQLVSFIYGYTTEAIDDQVLQLPGLVDPINFNHFSGYLTVGNGGTKKIHYWFVESSKDPLHDPIAFWTNGGPGCSGLLGMFTEQGPFRPNKDLTLSLNEFAWTNSANMVFIESPCGVGFSYSTNSNDYKTADALTASDNYDLIQALFQRFPEYSSNSFYISSESYGGHYMPTLARKIVEENNNLLSTKPKINFKGFAVGNPYTVRSLTLINTYFIIHFNYSFVSNRTFFLVLGLCLKHSGDDK